MSTEQFKPMLASDWDEAKVQFPCIAQPKIDGVRGLNMTGRLTGRSLKAHKNVYATEFFSHPALIGFDGEFAVAEDTHPELCRLTSSAMNTISGAPQLMWHLFDYITPVTAGLPYDRRYNLLDMRLGEMSKDPELKFLMQHLDIVPMEWCDNMEDLLALDNEWLDLGYEGTIIRHPYQAHKQGRSTVKEGGLLRIKRFIDAEAVVIEIVEGQTNGNEAKVNELGHTERSTHQENMIPNGQVGSLTCRMLKDVFDPQIKTKKLLSEGQIVTVAPGKMTAEMRKHYFENPSELLGEAIKFKLFPKGGKDKPRFPTFQSIRAASDMSE